MERMSKEKESGTLLGVGTAYLPVKEIKGEFYVKVSDFTRCMDSMRKELEEENKKLKEERDFFYKSAKQFREDAESWRKEAELLLGIKILGKTLSERIDDDKKVVRMDTSCMEEDTLQELRDLGEI